MSRTILTINSGSSSLKASLFRVDGTRRDWHTRQADQTEAFDVLVFSGGIGEHAPQIRNRICEPLGFLGFSLDAEANRDNRDMIQADGSRPILRMVANEEGMIRELVESLLRAVP